MVRRWHRSWFALGAATALVLLAGLAEAYLTIFPPQDHAEFLGEASPLTGSFTPHPVFGVTYRSWDTFVAENADRLPSFLPFERHDSAPPIWAFFGNSFVQAPGMLADLARHRVPDRRIFHLGRNEQPFVRLAQIELLLEHGLRPERIFVALMPVDLLVLGEQPLATIHVTAAGALTYTPRLPPAPVDRLIHDSRLARAAWFRAGRHRGNPAFDERALTARIDEPLLSDLRQLFAGLAAVTRARGIPVTVILIPAHEQVVKGAAYGFQDTVGALLRAQGFDVFDPRLAFGRQRDRAALYAPDKHLSPAGNELLLAEMLAHLDGAAASGPGDNAERTGP